MLRQCVRRGERLPRIALFCARDVKEYLYRSSAEFDEEKARQIEKLREKLNRL